MSGIKDQENIEELRRRLYERGNPDLKRGSQGLSQPTTQVPKTWEKPPVAVPTPPPASVQLSHGVSTPPTNDMSPRRTKKNYRLKILVAGFAFFVLAMGVSSMFLAFGRNSISAGNITIAASGPFTVGGGEELQMQVGVSNDNTVAIESATLLVEYPTGTQSATEQGKELYTERLALETIGQGETVNIPLRAIVFGEENQEKIVKVSVEYRVEGSNATFFKEAEPFRFKISSSPVTVRADTLKKISSGQETDVKLTIMSNSPNPVSQILVKAEYPTGFDFTKSNPAPEFGKNMWLIENLKPEEEKVITITGVVVGKETDEYAINFTVGVPNEREEQTLASIFATAQTQFEIEQPFLDIDLEIDGSTDAEAVAQPGRRSTVAIEMTNTLDDTLYDIEVEVELSGNAFSIYEVGPSSGYFDTSKNTITWNVSNTSNLKQANPGESKRLSFSVEPASGVNRTPQINVNVNVQARRVSESDVAEQLQGTAASVIRVVSSPTIRSQVSHGSEIFVDSGPIPPEVDTPTTYTLTMLIENGSNDITDAIVTTSLPAYVTWLDKTAGSGKVSYNATTRAIEWAAGDVDANAAAYASFQVSLLPRALQVGTLPTLLGEQRIRAVDRFTDTVVRAVNPALTTKIPGKPEADGVVRAQEDD
jgi:hypothetical protein